MKITSLTRKASLLLAIGIAVCVCRSVQTAEESSPAEDQDILKLMEIMDVEKSLKVVFPQVIGQLRDAFPDITEDELQRLERQVDARDLIKIAVPIYKKHFSHEEILGMIQFYSSPLGKKVIQEMPPMILEINAAAFEWGKSLGSRVFKQRAVQQSQATTQPVPRVEYSPPPEPITQPTESVTPSPNPTLPRQVKYVIMVNNQTLFSEKEPKPVGSGFKFISYPYGSEITVSGNVSILKVGDK